ncbi:MAG: glycosyltransferase family 2 protein [Paludibacteraceae bacterium]
MNSVCMATYNGEKFIAEQLTSILSQIAPDDEVIISDDGSTDNTCAIIESFGDKRITLLHNNAHNFKSNFINALQHACGKYIFLSDQDDVWLPNKYDICCQYLTQYDLVITDSIITNDILDTLQPSFFNFYHSGKGILKNILFHTYFGACMAFRREILPFAIPMPNTPEIAHDNWIGLVAEIVGKVYFIPQPLLLYRRHSQALTNLNETLLKRSKRSLWMKLWSRIVVLFHVCRFYLTFKVGKFK